ncbi:MAG: S49 family peptidase [Gammaproteobacteria bacterium]
MNERENGPPGRDPWTQNAAVPASGPGKTEGDDRWARDLVVKLASAAVVEQRRARRWGIFFKLLFFGYLFAVFWIAYAAKWGETTLIGQRHTAVISVDGVIASGKDANADDLIKSLRAAFRDSNTAGVVLYINSPGGSPVQAGQVYDEVMRLRAAHPKVPLYAVATDICASGAYYIAAAAQKIFADKASLVGSIGVRMDSFGFEQAIKYLGVERRLYTAGDNKGMLDPFLPERPEQVQFIHGLLNDIHQQFITAVKKGRGERLKNDPQLFSGLIWTGDKSLELGLIDGLADIREVAQNVIGAEKLVDYTSRSGLLDRLLESIGAGIGQTLQQVLGERFSLR